MGTTIRTLAMALWFPLLSGALTALATWLIWHYTALHCTPENAAMLMCRYSVLARYLTPEIWQDCLINASIVITLTGGSNLMLFIREHQRANRMEDLAEQVIVESVARLQRDEERVALAQERAEARAAQAEERAARFQELAEARAAQAEERAESRAAQAEERAAARAAQAEERAARAEERAIAAHQAFLDALNRMTANNGPNRPSAE